MPDKLYIKIISVVLLLTMLFSFTGCGFGKKPPQKDPSWMNPEIPDPNEDILYEDTITEETLTEFITTEVYLKELVSTENELTSMLLADKMISDVLMCRTIYVPQNHIADFSANSYTEELFGSDVDIKALADKISLGNGVIVTLVVLKRAGLQVPLASAIISAASTNMDSESSGLATDSLYADLAGEGGAVSDAEKTAARIIFAQATTSIVLSLVSLAVTIPSGGSSAVGVIAGIKIGISAVSMISSAQTAFKATDATEIDWNNIDWDGIGFSSAQQAVNDAGDGYVWGSVSGVVQGGDSGFADYLKFAAPYSSLDERLQGVPRVGSTLGFWTGAVGQSDFTLYEPITLADGRTITKITYKNAIPDFTPYEYARIKISAMTDERIGSNGNVTKADQALAESWTEAKHNGRSWSAQDVKNYRENNNLTWHEMSNMEYMQLIPEAANRKFSHLGGCSEYRIMIGQPGGSEFD